MKWRWGKVLSCLVIAWFMPRALIAHAAPQMFYIDEGFVGYPASFTLPGGKVSVSWDAGDLVAPTTLTMELEKRPTSTFQAIGPAPSSTQALDLSGNVLHVSWSNPNAFGPKGVQVIFKGCFKDSWTECQLVAQDGAGWSALKGDRATSSGTYQAASRHWSYMRTGSASWYKYKNCHCAASPDFPKGTHVRVRSLASGKTTVVRINDYGPERNIFPERAIDLDVVAFQELAPKGAGVIRVSVEPVLPTDPDYEIVESPVVATPKIIKQTEPMKAARTQPLVVADVVVKPRPVPKPVWNY